VAVLGIVVKQGYRSAGIGTEIMKALVEEARKMNLKVLTLALFATNERARHVYEKIGFVETGRIPKKHFKDNKFIDEIIMTKLME
jgi:RimJ/RimL family protein N-acetyltransferase